MALTVDQLKDAWLNLLRAEELANQQASGMHDDWVIAGSDLLNARSLLQRVAGPFEVAYGDEIPKGTCEELTLRAVEVLSHRAPGVDPSEVTLALIAATDALQVVRRRQAA